MGLLRTERRHLCRIASAAMLLLMVLRPPSAPAQEINREYALKAGFLYHFCQFIDWPRTAFASESSPLVIGVLGENPFGSFLGETVSGEVIRGRRIQLEHYGRPEEIRQCHILFISSSERSRFASILAKLRGRSIVTVGESDEFLRNGGMIALTASENRIRLRVNLVAVRAVNVSISSKLLRVAEIVKS